MRSTAIRTTRLLTAMALLVAGIARAGVEIEFQPESAADEWDARTYRAIWTEYGERIVAALEARTCLPFPEDRVGATVAEAVSNSGGPEHPMRLRASYMRQVKQSTLVHELGHRHLWQLAERLEEIDGHMTLYLVLDRVWADVWGEQFADERILGESDWDRDYSDAWTWARSLKPEQRLRLWNELLAMNGIPSGCDALLG